MNIDLALEALWKLAIFRYSGFEFEAVSDKWLPKPIKKKKNARKQGNELWPDNNRSKKDASASAKAAHMVHCFWGYCSSIFDPVRL